MYLSVSYHGAHTVSSNQWHLECILSAGTRNLAWSKYLLPSESERRLPTLAGTNHTGSSLKGTVRPALGTSLLAVPCCHARGLKQEWEGCVFPKMLVYQLRAFNACMSGV